MAGYSAIWCGQAPRVLLHAHLASRPGTGTGSAAPPTWNAWSDHAGRARRLRGRTAGVQRAGRGTSTCWWTSRPRWPPPGWSTASRACLLPQAAGRVPGPSPPLLAGHTAVVRLLFRWDSRRCPDQLSCASAPNSTTARP